MIPKEIINKLEPESANIKSGNPLLISMAISMKRIADILEEKYQYRTGEKNDPR